MLNLVVIRSANPDKLAAFYEILGLRFEKHAHGNGPEHFASTTGAITFEIYPRLDESKSTASVRLGFSVPHVEDAVAALMSSGGRLITPAKDSPWGRRAVIDDPEGHRIEVTQQSSDVKKS